MILLLWRHEFLSSVNEYLLFENVFQWSCLNLLLWSVLIHQNETRREGMPVRALVSAIGANPEPAPGLLLYRTEEKFADLTKWANQRHWRTLSLALEGLEAAFLLTSLKSVSWSQSSIVPWICSPSAVVVTVCPSAALSSLNISRLAVLFSTLKSWDNLHWSPYWQCPFLKYIQRTDLGSTPARVKTATFFIYKPAGTTWGFCFSTTGLNNNWFSSSLCFFSSLASWTMRQKQMLTNLSGCCCLLSHDILSN